MEDNQIGACILFWLIGGKRIRLLVCFYALLCMLCGCGVQAAHAQAGPAPEGISSLTLGPFELSSSSAIGVNLRGSQPLAVGLYNPDQGAGADSVRVRVFVTGPTTASSRSAVRAPLDTPQTVQLAPVTLSEAGRFECLVVAVFYPRGNTKGVAAARTFYIDNQGTPLPVTLTSFRVTGSASTVRLAWTSAAESNLNHYEAQVSSSGETWATVGAMGARGSGSYDLLLPAPAGLSYYRLRSVDNDGTSHYSATRAWAGAGTAAALVSVGGQHLAFAMRQGETPELVTVYDYAGRRRWAGTAAAAAALPGLPVTAGLYIVVLSTAQGGRYVARISQP
jgi:hypothetical protein